MSSKFLERDKLFAVPIRVYVRANSKEQAREIVETEIVLYPAEGFQWLDHILDVEDKTQWLDHLLDIEDKTHG